MDHEANIQAMITAIIPARGGSKGLPRKNLKIFHGTPLIGLSIILAKENTKIDRVVVNTDDVEIAEVAEAFKAEVIFRPLEMGSDAAEVDPLLVWSFEKLYPTKVSDQDIGVLLYCTSPLRCTKDITETINLLDNGYDSALTLAEDHRYLWSVNEDRSFNPTNYDPKTRASRQLENWNQYWENKAVYAFRVKDLLQTRCRINGKVGAHIMPWTRSVDIDSTDDFDLALALHDLQKND